MSETTITPINCITVSQENDLPIGFVFVAANSHRARSKMQGVCGGRKVIEHYRAKLNSKGPQHAALLSNEEYERAKSIKGVGKTREQRVSEWCPCWSFK